MNKVQKSMNFDIRARDSCAKLHTPFAQTLAPLRQPREPLARVSMVLFMFCMIPPVSVVTA